MTVTVCPVETLGNGLQCHIQPLCPFSHSGVGILPYFWARKRGHIARHWESQSINQSDLILNNNSDNDNNKLHPIFFGCLLCACQDAQNFALMNLILAITLYSACYYNPHLKHEKPEAKEG